MHVLATAASDKAYIAELQRKLTQAQQDASELKAAVYSLESRLGAYEKSTRKRKKEEKEAAERKAQNRHYLFFASVLFAVCMVLGLLSWNHALPSWCGAMGYTGCYLVAGMAILAGWN